MRAVITSKVEVERCQTVMPKLAESCAEESDASCHCHTPHDRAAVDPHRDLRGGIKIVSISFVGISAGSHTHYHVPTDLRIHIIRCRVRCFQLASETTS